MRIQVNARNRGYEFEARPDERVLHAGLRAGIALPYECATGTCGTCKATLVGGTVADGWAGAPGKKLVKPERREFLMCQCAASADLTLEVDKFVHAAEAGACTPDSCSVVLRAPRQIAPDVMAFSVQLEQPRDFDAGQFVLLAPLAMTGYRAYSMCNFERGARRLDFVVKRKPDGGFSEWLFGANREGERLSMFGPLGSATFDPMLAKNVLCIAGGSGIAGMMSILARAWRERYFERWRGWVFFGVRTMRDTFFLDELSSFQREFPERVQITVALSDEDVPASAARDWPALGFERGLVHEVTERVMTGKYHDVRAYVAGPPPCVDAAIRVLLLKAKLTTNNIRYDKYS
ncbi:MAG: 2Fe-2S iron-sulfur cluster binding domain-containing protein [Betaproteobacteria bacterium]|nr:MAG: 2Fe-2S iron-sulfur cluster binding domain-containing protein [Betaproteobacteria bacterium]